VVVVAVSVAVMVTESLAVCNLPTVKVLVPVAALVCVLVAVSVNVTIPVNVAIPESYGVAVAVLVDVAPPPSGLGCPQVPPAHASGLSHRLLEQHGWPAAPQTTQLPVEQMLLPRQLLLAQQG
jgi:hypothetical protein